MGIIHFLNVKNGDCTWIQHPSGHNTVIDVSCASEEEPRTETVFSEQRRGNYNQKSHPVNPIEYIKKFSESTIFRFILSHPDMDHMDGIEDFFSNLAVSNFWDTANTKQMDNDSDWGPYKKSDWDFYQKIRQKNNDPRTLNLYAGATGQYYNINENGESGADGLYILAPTKELVKEANSSGDYNDCSYVILYRTFSGKKIIFSGDSAEKTWDYILQNHKEDVTNIDILFAPHHGRKSGGNGEYLDTLNPKLTLFGNASSNDLDYSSWSNRNLKCITNNQANCVILDINTNDINIYVTHETFAKNRNSYSFYSEKFDAWYLSTI